MSNSNENYLVMSEADLNVALYMLKMQIADVMKDDLIKSIARLNSSAKNSIGKNKVIVRGQTVENLIDNQQRQSDILNSHIKYLLEDFRMKMSQKFKFNKPADNTETNAENNNKNNSDNDKTNYMYEKFDFKVTRGDGDTQQLCEECIEGADIYEVVEIFQRFLYAMTFTEKTIEKIKVCEHDDCCCG